MEIRKVTENPKKFKAAMRRFLLTHTFYTMDE
jgi:hypothetical protein